MNADFLQRNVENQHADKNDYVKIVPVDGLKFEKYYDST